MRREDADMMKLSELLMPVYSYLKEMNQPLREELINGRSNKRI